MMPHIALCCLGRRLAGLGKEGRGPGRGQQQPVGKERHAGMHQGFRRLARTFVAEFCRFAAGCEAIV